MATSWHPGPLLWQHAILAGNGITARLQARHEAKNSAVMATNRLLWQHYGNTMATWKNYIYQRFIVLCCYCCHKYIKRVVEHSTDHIAEYNSMKNRRKNQKGIYRELWQQWQQWQQIEIGSTPPPGHTRREWIGRGGTNGTISTADTRGGSAMPGRVTGILANH